ncbi:helix-turn-helix domain-containing protein [Paenibacillus piri]|uniref:helix-turn-helix domain-containing protein n=1 Tax=Paenibacillus piri TaxID=2547395 RepID=UPI00140483E4|nr:helix-turn-helix domain-containing protein [Paenibacillus piri]
MGKIWKYFRIRNWGLFIKLFIPLLLALIIPVAAVSFINYDVSKRNLEAEVGQSNLSTLQQTNVAIDTILQTTEKMQYHLVRYPEVQSFLDQYLNISHYQDVDIINKVTQTTEAYMEGSPFISNIYFFSSSNRLLVSAYTGINRKMTEQEIRNMERLSESENGSVWLAPYQQGLFAEEMENVQLIKFLYKGKGQINGFIDIQLNNKELLRLIEDIYIRKSGYITVLDDNGRVVLSKKGMNVLDRLSNQTPWLNGAEGSVKLIGQDQREWLVSYTTSGYNGWKYVASVPVDELQNKSLVIRSNIMLTCLLFAVIAVIVSLGTAQGLYSPIRSIRSLLRGVTVNERKLRQLLLRKDELGQINEAIQEIAAVKEQWEHSLPELKNYFLYRLAADDSSVRNDIQRYAAFFGLPVAAHYVVLVILFGQSPGTAMQGQTGRADDDNSFRTLVSKAFSDFFGEWPAAGEATGFFDQNNRFLGIVSFGGERERFAVDFPKELKRYCHEFHESLAARYGLQTDIVVGSLCDGLDRLHESFRDAMKALKYTFVLGPNVVIFSHEMEDKPAADPVKLDYAEYIKNALDAGRYKQAADIVKELRDVLKNNRYLSDSYVFHYRSLVNIIIQHIRTAPAANGWPLGEAQHKFARFEQEFANVDEATDWLCGMLERMDAERDDRQSLHIIAQKVVDIIESEYDQDPSLAELAERLDVTPGYLSRLFKDQLGQNFKEYLTAFKIEKAKRLLIETDYPIETIARKVGYNNHNQFARMFKKHVQVSAMEYRNRMSRR